jgi:hypothetical protein
MKLATIVNKAVSLSEVIFQYWDTELRKHHPNYPLVYPGEEDGPPPPQQKKLRELLSSLPEDTLYKLALLRDVGRGIVKTNDLEGGYQDLRDDWDNPAQLIEVLVDKPLDYDLPEGLARLKTAGIDLDKIDFTRPRARK